VGKKWAKSGGKVGERSHCLGCECLRPAENNWPFGVRARGELYVKLIVWALGGGRLMERPQRRRERGPHTRRQVGAKLAQLGQAHFCALGKPQLDPLERIESEGIAKETPACLEQARRTARGADVIWLVDG